MTLYIEDNKLLARMTSAGCPGPVAQFTPETNQEIRFTHVPVKRNGNCDEL